ncbi:hypothetical protein BSKO_08164 [Bryopsis sp. KO-2023]|nr:hypothetical protein BSKO_08164 [Bryopsis sp. KO-2023]
MMAKVHRMEKVSQLHNEIVAYARDVTPTAEEHEECERVIHIVRKACFDTFGSGVQVTPFGSYANGLATRASDVDLVITGLIKPDSPEGFFGYKQMRVAQNLQSLEEVLINNADLDLKQVQLVAHTKVPVLKCTTSLGVMIDISINDHSCTKAAMWVLEKVRQHPAVRPICLVLKDFLRRYGLSEVRDGGLGGFALTNVVIAHVLELMKAGAPTSDFGDVLISFFDHFGNVFDSEMQAVCVRRGGVVGKQWVGNDVMAYRRCRGYRPGQRTYRRHMSIYGERWFIENPVTGMDVAQGSYNIHLVRDRFISAFCALTGNAASKGGPRRSMLALIFNLRCF